MSFQTDSNNLEKIRYLTGRGFINPVIFLIQYF
jgi:hypothetical protein